MTDKEALQEIDRQEKRFAAAKCGRGLQLAKSAREYYQTIVKCRQKSADVAAECAAASGQIRLHLADRAPEGWNGVVFLSAGVTRVWPNRRLTLKVSPESLIRISDRAAENFKTPIAENVQGRENTEWSGILEGMLVGCMAQRLNRTLAWNAVTKRFDDKDANALIRPFVRKGWEF